MKLRRMRRIRCTQTLPTKWWFLVDPQHNAAIPKGTFRVYTCNNKIASYLHFHFQ